MAVFSNSLHFRSKAAVPKPMIETMIWMSQLSPVYYKQKTIPETLCNGEESALLLCIRLLLNENSV